MKAALPRSLKRSLSAVLEVLLPASCPLCGRDLPSEEEETPSCGECASRIPEAERYCSRCSAPVGPFLDTSNGCGHCRRDRFAFEAVFAAAEYRDGLRSAVLRAKRPGGGTAAVWLADRLWERREAELAALGVDLVAPVPQHWLKRIVAPHNPAELIARRLAVRLKASLDAHILSKVRRTPAQATLPPSVRRTNLRDAFVVVRPLHGRRILLVDDVLTTGTTANRASRALLDAGAAAVWVAVPARGIGG